MPFDLDIAFEKVFTLDFCKNHPLKEVILADYYTYSYGKEHKKLDDVSQRFTAHAGTGAGKFWKLFGRWFLPSLGLFRLDCRELGLIWSANITNFEQRYDHCQDIHDTFEQTLDQKNEWDATKLQEIDDLKERSRRSYTRHKDRARWFREWSRGLIDTVFPAEGITQNRIVHVDTLRKEFNHHNAYLHTVCRALRELPDFEVPKEVRPDFADLVRNLGKQQNYASMNRYVSIKPETLADRRFAAVKEDFRLRETFIFGGYDFARGLGALCERAIRSADTFMEGQWVAALLTAKNVMAITSVPYIRDGPAMSNMPQVAPPEVARLTENNFNVMMAILDAVPDDLPERALVMPPSRTHPGKIKGRAGPQSLGFGPAKADDPEAERARAMVSYHKINDLPYEGSKSKRVSGIPLTHVGELTVWGGGGEKGLTPMIEDSPEVIRKTYTEARVITMRDEAGRTVTEGNADPMEVDRSAVTKRSSRKRFVPEELIPATRRRGIPGEKTQDNTGLFIGGAAILLSAAIILK